VRTGVCACAFVCAAVAGACEDASPSLPPPPWVNTKLMQLHVALAEARGWVGSCRARLIPSCFACCADACVQSARLTYAGEEVMVEAVSQEEALQLIAVAGGGADVALPPPGGPERKSRRARKGRAPVKVDSSHTLGDLKLRIFEAIDVFPKNARLFVRSEGSPARGWGVGWGGAKGVQSCLVVVSVCVGGWGGAGRC
jgi:hypothetical protein